MSRRTRLGLGLALCLGLGACKELAPQESARPDPAEEARLALDRGTFLLRSGQPELAFKSFIRAAREPERRAEALTGAGLALEAQDLLGAARDYFERARDAAPEVPMVHNNLGVVLFRLGELEAARAAFRTAFALSSGRDLIAAQNLRTVEERLDARREREADTPIVAELQRLGSSEYRLIPATEDPPSTPAPDE